MLPRLGIWVLVITACAVAVVFFVGSEKASGALHVTKPHGDNSSSLDDALRLRDDALRLRDEAAALRDDAAALRDEAAALRDEAIAAAALRDERVCGGAASLAPPVTPARLSRSQVAALAVSAGFYRESGGAAGASTSHTSWHSFALAAFEEVKNETWACDAPSGLCALPDELRVIGAQPGQLLRPLVLLIGDSTDRDALSGGFCEAGGLGWHVYNHQPNVSLAYDDFLSCETEWGVIEMAFSYGVWLHGPYHMGFSSNRSVLDDTELRLPSLVAAVTARWGRAPDVVLYQSLLWTMREPTRAKGGNLRCWGLDQCQDLMREMLHSYAANVAALQAALPPSSSLILRTQSFSEGLARENSYPLLLPLNAGIRLLGAVKRVGVFDWAAMTQGLKDSILHNPADPVSGKQDYVHFNSKFSRVYIESLKGLVSVLVREPRAPTAHLSAWESLGLAELALDEDTPPPRATQSHSPTPSLTPSASPSPSSAPATPTTTPQPQPPLTTWTQHVSETTGRTFWHDSSTGVSTYDRPA